MPTPRLVYLSHRKQAADNATALRQRIETYLSQLTTGYFEDIGTVDWNSFYAQDVPLSFSKVLVQYRFFSIALSKHIDDARTVDYYEFYTGALEQLRTGASKYENEFSRAAQYLERDLQVEALAGAAAAFASLYLTFVGLELGNELFKPLWQSIDYSSNACVGLTRLCDEPMFAREVCPHNFDELRLRLINDEEHSKQVVELLGTICYRKDNLSALFETNCFAILCGYLHYDDTQRVADILWIVSNIAHSYHRFFGPSVLELVLQGFESTNEAIVQYCCIIVTEMSYAFDEVTEEFIRESGILDIVGDVLLNNKGNSKIVEQLLIFVRQMIEYRVIAGAEEYYEAIVAVQDENELNQQIVSDFLLELN